MIDFYKSIILVCDGMTGLAHRYSQKAKEMAEVEADPKRKTELLEIAEVCSYASPDTARSS